MKLNNLDWTEKDNLAVEGLNKGLIIAKEFLTYFAESQDFVKKINTAFGEAYSTEKAQNLRRQWAGDDFSQLPQIQLKPAAEINGALGAFSQDTNTIYLAQEYVGENHSKPEIIGQVLLEEFGHFVDSQINTRDAAGDEGAIFSALVRGKRLTDDELKKEKAENDIGSINVNGRIIEVENASISDSGGYEGSQETLKLSTKDGSVVNFYYEHYTIPDNFIIRYEGKNILETGFVGGSKTGTIKVPKGNSDQLEVIVATNDQGTAWDYSVEEIETEIKVKDARAVVEAGTGQTKEIIFNVTLSKASSVEVTVEYFTLVGTAVDGTIGSDRADFTPVKGTLTFAPGQTTQDIKIQVLGDTPVESKDTNYEIFARDTAYRDWEEGQDTDSFKNDNGNDVQPYADLGYRVDKFFNDGSTSFQATGMTSDEKFFLVLSNPDGGQIVEDSQTQKEKLLEDLKKDLGGDERSPKDQSIYDKVEQETQQLQSNDTSWTFATGTIYDKGKPPVLAVRGTAGLKDLLSDANPNGIGYNQFINNNGAVSNWLTQVSKPEQGITFEPNITGHSLGGALTQWIAASYSATGNKLGKIVTFNSPGISIGAANQFNSANAGKVTHYIASSDIVSMAGLSYIAGNYYLYDWNLGLSNLPLWIIGEHTHPILVNNIEDGGQLPAPSKLNFVKNFSSVASLNNSFFTYLPDRDYFITQLIIAQIPSVGPFLARAMTFRATIEAVRASLGLVIDASVFVAAFAKQSILKAFEAATKWGNAAFNAIKDWGESAWAGVKDWSDAAWNASIKWVDNAWDATKTWGSDAWNATKKWGSDAWDATTSWGSSAWDSFNNWFSSSSSKIDELNANPSQIANPWEATTYWGKEAWEATTSWSDQAWQALSQWSLDLWQSTTTWTPENWKATTTWSDEVWQATTKVDGAVDKLLFGGVGGDTLDGGNGNDLINGFEGSDSLSGNAKNDTLNGGLGSDSLKGGLGSDRFFFSSPTEGVDTIVDFEIGDRLIISGEAFDPGLTVGAALDAFKFVLGNSAADSDDRFIYKASTGELFFDPDGSGSAPQKQIANLSNKAPLSANDIYIDGSSNSPIIKLTEPISNVKAQQVNIKWEAFDPDSQGKISLYYDTDDQGFNGVVIADNLLETDGEGNYLWKPTNVTKGDYYVYGKIVDENNNTVYDYAKGLVQLQTSQTADLSVTQTSNPTSVSVAQNFTYTVQVKNNGSVKSQQVTLVETLPETVTFVSASVTPTQQQDNVLTFALNDIDLGQTKTVDIQVKAPILPEQITSTAEIISYTFDPNSANDQVSTVVNVAPPDLPDLSILRTNNTTSANLGQQYSYTLKVTNKGTQNATNVILTEKLPSQVNFIQATSSQGSVFYNYFTDKYQVALGTLAKNQIATINFTVKPFASGQLITNTSVAGTQPDINQNDNNLTSVYTVNSQTPPAADLELTQTLNNTQPKVGDQITYTLTVTNKGPGVASGIQVKDLLPPQLSFVSASSIQGTYDSPTGIWDVGNIRDNLSRSLSLTAKLVAPGLITNNAEVIAVNETDPDSAPGNNNPTEDDQTKLEITVVDDSFGQIKISDLSVTEGNSGNTTANFTVSLVQAITNTVTVNYSTANDTALAPSDYASVSGVLTFAPGQTVKTVSVNVVGDTVVEANETFKVNLSGAVNAVINDSQGIGTIVNDDVVLPKITISDVSLTEGNTGLNPFNFVVGLSNSSATPVTVNLTTANGTAFAGSDYTSTSGIITFAAGQTLRTVSVNVVGDTVVEASETFSVNLTSPVGATISDSQGVGTIINDDVVLPKITISDMSLTEGNTGVKPFNFVVGLSNTSATPVIVNLITGNGIAFAGSDYITTSGVITFTAGQTLRTVSVNVVGDTVVEANETFSVNLTTPVGAVISDSQGIGTIVNDDVVLPKITISDVALTEGNSGLKPFNFVVGLSNSSLTPVTVNLATGNGIAFAGSDYLTTTGIVTFAAGQTLRTVSVNVVGDTVVEANETFSVNLTSPVGAVIADSQGIGTIINDDVDVVLPQITISDVALTEGNSGLKPFNFVVSLSKTSTSPISVKYTTANGTAFANSDYGFSTGTITFSAGQTLKTIAVNVIGDPYVEASETFNLNLSGATGATISDSQGIGTIINDDVVTTLPSLSIADVALTEGNSSTKPFGFVAKLSKTSTSPISVKYTTANGTAFAGSDYLTTTGIITFAAGQTLRTVSVSVVGDTLVEASETFNLNLSGAVGATLGDSQGVGTIINDDVVTTLPSLSIADVALTEGNSSTKPFGFVAKLSKTSTSPVTVKYTTSNSTAFAGSDYLTTTGIVTFAPGQTLRTVSVNVVGDTLVEASETFNLNLSGAVGATLGDAQGIGTIINDDVVTTLPSLSIADVALSEGNSGSKPFAFVAKLSKTSTSPISVRYTTANGTAFAGSDYLTTTGIVTFAAGQTLRTISVNVVGDTLVESNETFSVNLSSATGATISDSQGIGTIINDDAGVRSLSISDVFLTEGNSSFKKANFVVKLSSSSSTAVSVKYATANITAFAGSDYALNTGVITFSAGQTVKTLSANVFGDTVVEPNETFSMNLSGAVGATISDGFGLGTIVNDDQKPVKGNLLQDELLGRVKTITGTASSDTFTLGDASGAYYASNGNQDYALLVNFEQSKDRIQLHGSANDYQISKGTLGAKIFLNKTELIGVVAGVNQVDSLSLSFVSQFS